MTAEALKTMMAPNSTSTTVATNKTLSDCSCRAISALRAWTSRASLGLLAAAWTCARFRVASVASARGWSADLKRQRLVCCRLGRGHLPVHGIFFRELRLRARVFRPNSLLNADFVNVHRVGRSRLRCLLLEARAFLRALRGKLHGGGNTFRSRLAPGPRPRQGGRFRDGGIFLFSRSAGLQVPGQSSHDLLERAPPVFVVSELVKARARGSEEDDVTRAGPLERLAHRRLEVPRVDHLDRPGGFLSDAVRRGGKQEDVTHPAFDERDERQVRRPFVLSPEDQMHAALESRKRFGGGIHAGALGVVVKVHASDPAHEFQPVLDAFELEHGAPQGVEVRTDDAGG